MVLLLMPKDINKHLKKLLSVKLKQIILWSHQPLGLQILNNYYKNVKFKQRRDKEREKVTERKFNPGLNLEVPSNPALLFPPKKKAKEGLGKDSKEVASLPVLTSGGSPVPEFSSCCVWRCTVFVSKAVHAKGTICSLLWRWCSCERS